MGSVFRKTYTKPIPASAEIIVYRGKRHARWKDKKGKTHKELVTTGKNGEDRLLIQSRTYTAKYRDGQGIVREVSTGCRQEDTARRRLAELQRRAELVKANVISAEEDEISQHQRKPLPQHFSDYIDHQTARGLHPARIKNTGSRLTRIALDCGFSQLVDLNANALECWLLDRQQEGMSPGARNGYREAWVAFGNWCVKTKRLLKNPVASVPKADAKADPRRQRRSLTEQDLERLLYISRRRPLAEYGRETIRKTDEEKVGRRSWKKAPLTLSNIDMACERAKVRVKKPQFRAEKEREGRERALLFKTYLLTGLRKSELAALQVRHLELDGPTPHAFLPAKNEKNRKGAEIALREDLVSELQTWLREKLDLMRADALRRGEPMPEELPAMTPLFRVPTSLLRLLNRDLKAAGIPKKDDRGRSVDLHALRHTFGTHLSKGGVAPRVAQAAMRHSCIDLTMNTYVDPRLLDVGEALRALPQLSLDGALPLTKREVAQGNGETQEASVWLAPPLAPEAAHDGRLVSKCDESDVDEEEVEEKTEIVVSADSGNKKEPSTIPVKDSFQSGRQDLNLRPLRPERRALP